MRRNTHVIWRLFGQSGNQIDQLYLGYIACTELISWVKRQYTFLINPE